MLFETVITTMAVTVADKLAEQGVPKVLEALLAVQKNQREQLAYLQRIDRNVQVLLEGPFNTAMELLDDAMRPHRTPEEHKAGIITAREKLFDALGQERENAIRISLIHFYIGICEIELRRFQDAQDRFIKALEYGKDATMERLQAAHKEENLFYRYVYWDYNRVHKRAEPAIAMMPYLRALWKITVRLGADGHSIPWYEVSPSLAHFYPWYPPHDWRPKDW